MKPTIAPLYLSLFLHILTLLVSGDPPPIYTPVEDITLNCGYSGSLQDFYSNRNWTGDINSKLSPIEAGNTTSQVKEAPPSSSSASQVPYTTARLSCYEFTYRFDNLTAGQKFIRLYFNPASYPNFEHSKALFSVKVGRYTLLNDLNASATYCRC
ncbi:putative non-specific serine/threonine protein kinase [Rosa chinensis]|uniref:Putative non-specific serine/threonine protein kinase n=1 Tax=Rosa chinensis TaxID=74649 RepID=A0A2P6S3S1_ROSCH|nr:putative non-specific serine/threonine protein kinase [Rosa chinensis]